MMRVNHDDAKGKEVKDVIMLERERVLLVTYTDSSFSCLVSVDRNEILDCPRQMLPIDLIELGVLDSREYLRLRKQ